MTVLSKVNLSNSENKQSSVFYLLELGSYESRYVVGVYDSIDYLNQLVKVITDSYNEYCDSDEDWVWFDSDSEIVRFRTSPDEITITKIELDTLQDNNENVFKINNDLTITKIKE